VRVYALWYSLKWQECKGFFREIGNGLFSLDDPKQNTPTFLNVFLDAFTP
jgi:hypothetical protein